MLVYSAWLSVATRLYLGVMDGYEWNKYLFTGPVPSRVKYFPGDDARA